ncbi:MAG: hypothetical protein HON61_01145 [Alphaproteobacteria bacterium]|jgi:hypothetical protein|nr:hypothetical protein [Alphaproteobacteria bacterium]
MVSKEISDCWIISSGLIGCENQCIGLAEELNLKYEIKRVNPSKLLSMIAPFGKPKKRERLNKPYPKIIIGAGRKVVPYIKNIKKLSKNKCLTIYLQNPKINSNNFGLVWAPKHDNIKGNNVISTLLSPGRVSKELLGLEKDKWESEFLKLPKPYISILIGGKSKAFNFSTNDCLNILKKINQAIDLGWTPLISTSRRTPKNLILDIKDLIKDKPHYIYDNTGENPYYAILATSDVALVTPDSVNMLSETLTAGLPTFIFDLKCKSKRINNFLTNLKNEKYIKDFNETIEIYNFKKTNATSVIANHIKTLNHL